MSPKENMARPGWKRSVIHSALVVAFSPLFFVTQAKAVPPQCVHTANIATSVVVQQMPCADDVVTVTSTGSVVVPYDNGAAMAFIYTKGLTGSLTNAGLVSAQASADLVGDHLYAMNTAIIGDMSGALNNRGTFSATASGSGDQVIAGGVTMQGAMSGTFDNDGTISALASGVASDYDVGAQGVVVAGGISGVLRNGGTISASASGVSNKDVIDAYGVYTTGLSGKLSNGGTISAAAAGVAKDGIEAHGIRIEHDLSGILDNSGAISAYASGNAGVVANGVEINNAVLAGGSFTNSGTVSAVASNASGTSTATAYGVINKTLMGAMNNSGTISADASGNAHDLFASGVGMFNVSSAGSLNNSGTISAIVHGDGDTIEAYGVYVGTIDGVLNNSGAILAVASGSATSQWAFGVRVMNELNGTLINSGSIIASGLKATSILVSAGKGSIINSGLLQGNLYVGGSIKVDNAGLIEIPTTGPSMGGNGFGQISTDYTQQAGGQLWLGAKSAALYGTFTVGQVADFSASHTIGIRPVVNNTLAVGQVLQDVVSAGSWSGITTGGAVAVTGTPLFSYSGIEDGSGHIDVTVTGKRSFSDILDSSFGVANTLDGLVGSYTGTGAMDPLLDTLYGFNAQSEVEAAAQKLSPMLADGMNRTTYGVVQDIGRIIQTRQDANRGLASGDLFYGDREFWFKPFGSRADQGERSGIPGYEAKNYGLVFGVDGEISETARVGGAFGYAHSDVDRKSSAAQQSGDIESYQLVAYGSYSLDPKTDVSFQGSYGYHKNDSQRYINIGSLTPVMAKGDYAGWSGNLGAAISQSYDLNPATTFTPSLRADYTAINSQGYTESGAGALGLSVRSNKTEALLLGVDGKLSYALNETSKLTANLGIAYDAMADQGSVTSSFVGGGAAFSTKGINPSPWVVRGGLGYVMSRSKSLELTARYDLEARPSSYTNQTASLNLRMPF